MEHIKLSQLNNYIITPKCSDIYTPTTKCSYVDVYWSKYWGKTLPFYKYVKTTSYNLNKFIQSLVSHKNMRPSVYEKLLNLLKNTYIGDIQGYKACYFVKKTHISIKKILEKNINIVVVLTHKQYDSFMDIKKLLDNYKNSSI